MSEIIDNGSFLITEEHGSIPLLGHEMKYRVSTNEVLYEPLVRFCQAQEMNVAIVPAPRGGGIAFAQATKVLDSRRSKATIEDDSWDGGICQESWSVRTLKKCNEYVLIRERIGQRGGKRDLEQVKLYRLRYLESDDDISAEEWTRRFMLRTQGITQQQVTETPEGEPVYEPVEAAQDITLRRRVRIESYDEDEGIEDEDQHDAFRASLQQRFIEICKSVDQVLMRAKLKNLMRRHNAIQDPTVKGGVVQILNQMKAEELEEGRIQPHLETLGPYARLLRYWGNTNRPDPTADDAVWVNESGKVDYRTKGNLRMVPLVETDTVLDELALNVEHNINQAFGEMYESIREVLNDLNENALEKGEKGSETRAAHAHKRAEAFTANAQKLFEEVKEWEKSLGRELSVRTTPYKDQMDDMDARLAAIKSVDQETAEKFMKLVKKEGEKKDEGFEGLASIFG